MLYIRRFHQFIHLYINVIIYNIKTYIFIKKKMIKNISTTLNNCCVTNNNYLEWGSNNMS